MDPELIVSSIIGILITCYPEVELARAVVSDYNLGSDRETLLDWTLDIAYTRNDPQLMLLITSLELGRSVCFKKMQKAVKDEEYNCARALLEYFPRPKILGSVISRVLADLLARRGKIVSNGVYSFCSFEETLFFSWLCNAEADLEIQCEEGNTPLILAARSGYLDLANLFINFGANVNVRDSRGRTPLQLAASLGFSAICDSLLRAKANPLLRDFNNISPLVWTKYFADPALLAKFREMEEFYSETPPRMKPGETNESHFS